MLEVQASFRRRNMSAHEDRFLESRDQRIKELREAAERVVGSWDRGSLDMALATDSGSVASHIDTICLLAASLLEAAP